MNWPPKRLLVFTTGAQTPVSGRSDCPGVCLAYGESIESVSAQIETTASVLKAGLSRDSLQEMLPPGAARNALDCALWDLEAKKSGCRVWEMIGIRMPGQLVCAYTLSLSDADTMRAAASRHAHLPLLKMKVGSDGVMERVIAVRAGAPNASLIRTARCYWPKTGSRA